MGVMPRRSTPAATALATWHVYTDTAEYTLHGFPALSALRHAATCQFMFYGANSFTSDLGVWNVAKVTNMDVMPQRSTPVLLLHCRRHALDFLVHLYAHARGRAQPEHASWLQSAERLAVCCDFSDDVPWCKLIHIRSERMGRGQRECAR